ncbi:MAG: hypothetical protein ABL962_19755 [Fimbriimonadaceae bacterium]
MNLPKCKSPHSLRVLVSSDVALTALAEFSLNAGNTIGDEVVYVGKVGEVGSFPDKGIVITEADADTASAAFAGADNDL